MQIYRSSLGRFLRWGLLVAAAGLIPAASSPRRAPRLELSTNALSFNAPSSGPNPGPQSVTVKNTGNGNMSWSVSESESWLTLNISGGSLLQNQTQPFQVSVIVANAVVGTNTGTITVNGGGNADDSPQDVIVTLVVSASPVIGLSAASLTFNAPVGGAAAAQNVNVTNVGGGTLNWSANDGGTPWLIQNPASGPLTAGQTVGMSVSVNVAGLSPGPYSATITVSGGAGVASKTIGVTLNVSSQPAIGLSPSSLSFDVPFNWPDPISQTVTITNVGGQPLDWDANDLGTTWLSQNPASAAVPLGPGLSQTMTVTVIPAGLAEGGHSATIEMTGTNATTKIITVSVNVTQAPRIGLNPGSLLFDVTAGGGVSAGQALSVTNSGGGTLGWNASADVLWIKLIPTGGSLGAVTSEPMSVSVDPAALAEGVYTGTITVTASGASNTPQLIGVTAQVGPPPVVVPAEHVAAGQCGSVGLDLAAPLAFLWWIRRRRKGVRS